MRSFFRRFAAAVRRSATFVICSGLLASAAQAQDSTLTRLVRKHSFPLQQTGAQFSGAGWERLQQDVRKSQLVLIGEQHGVAEVPVFTAALARELQPALYVTEIDKYLAQELTRLTARPGLPTAFMKQYPMGLAFYSWAEEFELARTLRAQNAAIVGIEQVAATGPAYFFERMAAEVKRKSTQAYLRQRAATFQRQDRAYLLGTGKAGSMQMLQESGIDSLLMLTRQERPAVQRMVQEFITSYRIFQGQARGTGGHKERINLMKRNLLQGLQAYQATPNQPLPKMLFKFGANHMARGRSMWGDIYDVGNLAANLAEAQDHKSLHIMILGKQGTAVGGMHPEDFSKNVATYSQADGPYVKPFVPATNTNWNAVDLRPLRRALLAGKLQVGDSELEAAILGYDYIVIIPKTTASRNY